MRFKNTYITFTHCELYITQISGLLQPFFIIICFSPLSDVGGAVVFEVEKDEEDTEKKDEMDDDTMFTGLGDDDKSKPSVAPRWVTRVFAADCLCRIILLCENEKAHFDLAAARSAKAKNPKGTFQHAAGREVPKVAYEDFLHTRKY